MMKKNKITPGMLQAQYRMVVNPETRMVWDFETKEYTKYRKWNHFDNENPVSDGKKMPVIGFICDECRCGNNYEKLFYVNGKVVHESCALKILGGRV